MSKGNKCPIDSSSSNEKDFRNSHYQYHSQNYHDIPTHKKSDNPLSHICKYLDVQDNAKSSKENVELALEVEINESLKHVLTNPDRDSSDLLDVTIIRPSDSDTTHETTVALYKDEVRDFISLVEQHQKQQQGEGKSSNRHREHKSKERNQKRDVPKHTEQKHESKLRKECACLEHTSSHKMLDRSRKIDENPKHVYATINTFDKLKQQLQCQNVNRDNDKPGTPCMCQHCGIVGVLVQSQKGPVAQFPPLEEPSPVEHTPRSTYRSRDATPPRRDVTPTRRDAKLRKIIDLRKRKSIDQIELLREINNRIKSLEKRIALQEETAVPREYLKHILHKVLTQYNFKTNVATDAKLKNNATQYSAKNIAEPKVQFGPRNWENSDNKSRDNKSKCYQVHTLREDPQRWMDYAKSTGEGVEKPKSSKDLYWFWGEEVVKPGCDLKNKIIKLLDDKLKKPNDMKGGDCTIPKIDRIHQYFKSEKANSDITDEGIRVERDDKTIFLNVEQSYDYHFPHNTNNNTNNTNIPPSTISNKEDSSICGRPICEPTMPSRANKFSNLRNLVPKPVYPFDVKKTIDDSIFKKNIEAQKERNKEKHQPAVEEKFYNTYASNSITTESKASMDYIIQKLKNTGLVIESGLKRNKEDEIDAKFQIPKGRDVPISLIKDKVIRGGFRTRKENAPTPPGSIDFKFVNPKIKHWSEESSTSEDKFMRHKAKILAEKKEPVALEKKESLIYKLDFLKNLAKNKSTDQSRVLNKIWAQAKNSAKSKKDAVYIKIPFKNVNTCETPDNLIEMHLTLEELETVVKSAKRPSSPANVKVQSYKSTSEIDFGQRKHQEIKSANREILKSRHTSAKGHRHRDKR